MKKNLLAGYSYLGKAAKTFAIASVVCIGVSFNAAAQWVIYDASVLPNEFETSRFVTSNVNPSITPTAPAIVATEQSIVDDPDISGNKLLNFEIKSEPHQSFLWRQNFPTAPAPTAATVVVRAKGIEGYNRVLELDLDFGTFRESVYINTDGSFTFNYAKANEANTEDLENAPLNINVMEWHTYRVTKSGATTSLYIDEATTPIATGITLLGDRKENYFRFGDGNSGLTYGAQYDYVIWDYSGAYSPAQKALPAGGPTSAKAKITRENGVAVYPNPSVDKFTVTHPMAMKGANIEVYATSGVKLAAFSTVPGTEKTNVNLSKLAKGSYIVVYSDDKERITSRIVKQ